MKTITMDFEVYQRELNEQRTVGYMEGIESVAEFVEAKDETFLEWASEGPNIHWEIIIKGLGRKTGFMEIS